MSKAAQKRVETFVKDLYMQLKDENASFESQGALFVCKTLELEKSIVRDISKLIQGCYTYRREDLGLELVLNTQRTKGTITIKKT